MDAAGKGKHLRGLALRAYVQGAHTAVNSGDDDMRAIAKMKRALFGLMLVAWCASAAAQVGETVSFSSGDKVLQGMVYRPSGPGPFPAVLYNHGSAPGMLSKQASRIS